MCEDVAAAPRRDGLSRRRVLQGAIGLAAVAGIGLPRRAAAAPLPPRAPSAAGLNAYAMAMHLHASTSEGAGSMRSHLAQAATNGFDVAWFTEHDWRRRRLLYRPSYHFAAKDFAYGGSWSMVKLPNTGSLTSTSVGQLVTSPVSPNDTAAGAGSLRLRATSTGTTAGTLRYTIDSSPSRLNMIARITGRVVSIDVLPNAVGPNAWGEIRVALSRQPAGVNRPAGIVALLYRLRSDITTRTVTAQGTTAVVDVPVIPRSWQTVVLDLSGDILRAWPDIDPRDNALTGLELHALSRRLAPADIYFGYLRFDEQAGYDALGIEHDLLAAYAPLTPTVLGLAGTEISLGPHINQFGGVQTPYPYGPVTSLWSKLGEIRPSVVSFIHAQGGLASINHPFKPRDSGGLTSAAAVAQDLLLIGAGGADILEVGFAARDGAAIGDYLAVWDTLNRNALFLTANGTSDDHTGNGWANLANRYYTGAWAATREESALLGALAAGSAYVGYLGGFGGTIDMAMDSPATGGTVPMGAVSISAETSRVLAIDVTALPLGGTVQVVRGDVDRAGALDPTATSSVVATLNATDLATSNLRTVDTSDDCFVRLQVLDGAGKVVGFGQPIWVLKSDPGTVPTARQTPA
jgi:hypothetical protein